MGRAGEHHHDVDVAGVVAAAVAEDDFRIRPRREIAARPCSQLLVIFDRGDVSVLADDLGQYGAVLASASAHLQHMMTAPEVEMVEVLRPEARHPVVKAARRIDRYQHVVIDPGRVGIR